MDKGTLNDQGWVKSSRHKSQAFSCSEAIHIYSPPADANSQQESFSSRSREGNRKFGSLGANVHRSQHSKSLPQFNFLFHFDLKRKFPTSQKSVRSPLSREFRSQQCAFDVWQHICLLMAENKFSPDAYLGRTYIFDQYPLTISIDCISINQWGSLISVCVSSIIQRSLSAAIQHSGRISFGINI